MEKLVGKVERNKEEIGKEYVEEEIVRVDFIVFYV